MKSLTSHRQPHLPRSLALFPLLVVAVGGACLGAGMTQPASTCAIWSIQLPLVLSTCALMHVIHGDFGETVSRWIPECYWIQVFIWLVFGGALTIVTRICRNRSLQPRSEIFAGDRAMNTWNGTALSYCRTHQDSHGRCNMGTCAVKVVRRDSRGRRALRSSPSAMAKCLFGCRHWRWSGGVPAPSISHERIFTSGESGRRHVQ